MLPDARSGPLRNEGNVKLGDYDDIHGSIQDQIDISGVLHRMFAGRFGAKQSRCFSVARVRGDDHMYWLVYVPLFFYIK